ncbi:hypothetical protein [Leifsonia soli]|uniref:Uncharacterized protein n=1 Tax=Leifsonia soli TaxID=582665 RepID=A0A852T4B9_9MICO|nr:hypothetical protein [Leifsonia soli]NYD76027.1 hypothetical protein [Leifsonia soli]
MPESIFDTEDATLKFKEREWQITRTATYEWSISSEDGDSVGVIRCVTPLGNDGNSVFDLELPGKPESKETEGTDWLSMIEYAANEYLDTNEPNSAGYRE